ncbi:MarR family winged helix-turn-helix transcriptional regulator [Streptomyces sp. CA-106131]|uniref:MarR family winged helix-turn-helix transcriptional regulator n=1 Tax=Streptomyces sp. CA-106131 TaxID=3240045 RepID=UPI003D8E394D
MDRRTPRAGPAARRLTARQLTVWRSLMDTMEELSRRLTAQLQQVGLSAGDYLVMLTLSEAAGRRLRSSELADAIGWQRSRLSHHLGRMERRGLVRREKCPTDSRGAVVTITDEGLRSFRLASAPHLRAVKHYFADALTEHQFEELESILNAVRTHLADLGQEIDSERMCS